jgi:hypothetical protein
VIAQGASDSMVNAVERKYGLHAAPTIFDGCTLDTLVMNWHDPDHFFDFGIIRQVLGLAYDQMSVKSREIWRVSVTHMEWPSNYDRPTFDLSQIMTARYSMLLTRRMLTSAVCKMAGLVPDNTYRALCDVFRLRNLIFSTHSHTEATLIPVRDHMRTTIRHAKAAFGDDVCNRTIWHALIQFVTRDLVILKNPNLARTSIFETNHQSKTERCCFVIVTWHRWQKFGSILANVVSREGHCRTPKRNVNYAVCFGGTVLA